MNFFMKHVNLSLIMAVLLSSFLQRRFKIGYNRAARLIDMMEQQGFISEVTWKQTERCAHYRSRTRNDYKKLVK